MLSLFEKFYADTNNFSSNKCALTFEIYGGCEFISIDFFDTKFTVTANIGDKTACVKLFTRPTCKVEYSMFDNYDVSLDNVYDFILSKITE